MSQLLLSFYSDDFTGSTDALEQLTLAGIRTALFIKPPTPRQLARYKNLRAIGVAGLTRSLLPDAMQRELRVLKQIKALGARHVHYKICSTFDSSPSVGNLGCVLDAATKIFRAPFVPLLVAAPALGRHCVFGNLFASYGIGSAGAMHRLDRHPSISQHPITPMTEADLRVHLGRQTNKRIGLFDILKVALPMKEARAALQQLLADQPEVVLFDALYPEQLAGIGRLLDEYASPAQPLFSIGSSGVETALGGHWSQRRRQRPHNLQRALAQLPAGTRAPPTKQILIGSGSCSQVTAGQIAWALAHGFAEVPLNVAVLASSREATREVRRATDAAANLLQAGSSVIVNTAGNSDQAVAARLGNNPGQIIGTALGEVLRGALAQSKVGRLCLAGGDTSSFAARALGIESLEMLAPLTPGAPLCRATAPGSPVGGLEVVCKGGQVGGEDYFGIVKRGSEW